MEKDKELNNSDLSNVSGGSDLDKYLKTLAGNDKDKKLVDYETSFHLDIDSSVDYEDDGKLIIVKCENTNPK